MLSALSRHVPQASILTRRALTIPNGVTLSSRTFSVLPARCNNTNTNDGQRTDSALLSTNAADTIADPGPNSEQAAATQTIPDLPDLPPPVKGWPTPWVTQEEFEKYVVPLYSHGWTLPLTMVGFPKGALNATQLSKGFEFEGMAEAVQFLQKVVEISTAEKHHPSFNFSRHGKNDVRMFLCTHTALRPEWPEDVKAETESEADLASSSTPSTTASASRCIPGLTLRDVRYAILLDRVYNKPTPPAIDPTPGWESLYRAQRHALGFSECRLCGSTTHGLKECPTRLERRPIHACPSCGSEEHWGVDCPSKKNSKNTKMEQRPEPQQKARQRSPQVQRRTGAQTWTREDDGEASSSPEYTPKRPFVVRQPPNVLFRDESGTTTPPKPCPNCGGNHWKSGCREPQVLPEWVKKLSLPVP